MFTIRSGEHGPRVTVLQVLLNSHGCTGTDGKRLNVDGAYGRNTRDAVKAAATMAEGGDLTGAVATPALVRQLLADVDLQVVSSVDLGDPALQADAAALQRNFDDPILLGGMCNGLVAMVQAVQSRGRPGHVAALRFVGHGNLGDWLTISVGSVAHLREGNAAERREYGFIKQEIYSYISADNYDKVNTIVAPLKGIFAKFAFAEHLGCTLGAKPQTRKVLQKLADLWGVPIRVGLQTQPVGMVTEIKGPVFTAYPGNQTLTSWSRQFQTLELAGQSRALPAR